MIIEVCRLLGCSQSCGHRVGSNGAPRTWSPPERSTSGLWQSQGRLNCPDRMHPSWSVRLLAPVSSFPSQPTRLVAKRLVTAAVTKYGPYSPCLLPAEPSPKSSRRGKWVAAQLVRPGSPCGSWVLVAVLVTDTARPFICSARLPPTGCGGFCLTTRGWRWRQRSWRL
jgi:hypothetical protein